MNEPVGRTTKNPALLSLFRETKGKQLVIALAVFVLAFSVRYYHNFTLEHRVWYLEDAQNFLRSGNAILLAARKNKDPGSFLKYTFDDAKNYSGLYIAYNSDKLVDRIITDGPIFPACLALTEAALGLNPEAPDYESISKKLTITNSIVDSLTCALLVFMGSLFFGLQAGAIAGVIYALYPAAIVNTQWCMSETFGAFMFVIAALAITKLLTLKSSCATPARILTGTATGAFLGLTALSKPTFPAALLGLAIALIGATILKKTGIVSGCEPQASEREQVSLLRRLSPFIAAGIAFIITISPWLLYTKQALGEVKLSTNRLPAFNLLSGNLSRIDGWSPFPSKIPFTQDMNLATRMIVDDARSNPLDFALLEMKKVGRLWSSVWNDCKYPILGMNTSVQTVFHQLMLLLAMCWGLIFLSRGKQKFKNIEIIGSALIGGAMVFPFVYLPFTAIDRYNFSAMPFIALAAAAAVARTKSETSSLRPFAIGIGVFCIIAAITNEFRWLSSPINGYLPPQLSVWTPWVVSALAVVAYAGLFLWIGKDICRWTNGTTSWKRPPLFASIWTLAGFTLVASAITGSVISSRTWSEWKSPITDESVSQTIVVPKDLGNLSPSSFVIVDLHDDQPLPRLSLTLNEHSLEADAVPLPMIQRDNDSIVYALALQARVTDQDFRAFRHWYAIPFPTKFLNPGEPNKIVLQNARPTHPVTIFGDYVAPSAGGKDGLQFLPSIGSLSWNYAYEASDWRNPVEARILEPIQLDGLTTESAYIKGGRADKQDLSPEAGRQWGRYRIRLLVKEVPDRRLPTPGTSTLQDATLYDGQTTKTIYSQAANTLHTADGGNPMTFYLTDKALPIEEAVLKESLIRFSCELKMPKREGNACVNLVFRTGNDDVWSPAWQPYSIPVDNQWKNVTIVDRFPELLFEHAGISVTPILTPFSDDLLFANKRKATKQKVDVRNARLELVKDNVGPRRNLFDWTVL